MRCIVQILQFSYRSYLQHVPGWNPLHGDRCICVGQLKLGLIAQNCIAPGFCTLLTNTLVAGEEKSDNRWRKVKNPMPQEWTQHYRRGVGYELYQVAFSRYFKNMSFSTAQEMCYLDLHLMLVAVSLVSVDELHTAEILVNPTDLHIDPATICAFVLASSETSAKRVSGYYPRAQEARRGSPSLNQLVGSSALLSLVNSPSRPNIGPGDKKVDRRRRAPIVAVPTAAVTESSRHVTFCKMPQSKQFGAPFEGVRRPSHGPGPHVPIWTDRTGTFHWVQRPTRSILLNKERERHEFSDHIVVCVLANKHSPPLGLCNLLMPLRLVSIPRDELHDILIVADRRFVENELPAIAHFPRVWVLPGSPLNMATLRDANLPQCSSCVVITSQNSADITKYRTNPYLLDKETILCTLNIKAFPRCDPPFLPKLKRAADADGDGVEEENESVEDEHQSIGEHLNILTELLHQKNAGFLIEGDSGKEEFIMCEGTQHYLMIFNVGSNKSFLIDTCTHIN